jgi:hypothetical protein
METYRQNLNSSRLRLLHSSTDLAELVVRRACDDVRNHPPCLPLWAFRLCQWVNRGRIGYSLVWDRLKCAALSGGAQETWVDRVLYRSFASTMANRIEPMPLNILAGGLH